MGEFDLLEREGIRSRRGRLLVDGSPAFDFDNSEILASATEVINLASNTPHGTAIAKYLPLDLLEIINDQGEDINVILNDVITRRVKGNTVFSMGDRKFTSLKIVNRSAVNAIAANTIRIVVERAPASADSEARRRVRAGVR